MGLTVQSVCNELSRTALIDAAIIRDLGQRWVQSGGTSAEPPERFLKWLVAGNVITEYQAGVLGRGNADQLFLGPYKVMERIGKGSLAGVYRAIHQTGQTVAIKVLPPSKSRDPQVLGRFKREARLAVQLVHPNIVRTFQAGQANSLHYLVMEVLDGEPLDEVLARRGPLLPAEAARLAHQVLLALGQMHEKGMIHRDIKPANLMLVGGSADSSVGGTLKLLDIGTGRALFDEPEEAGELTNEGDLLGTPEYMSPEQARDPRTADIRADIYSAGCVLYYALAGRPPFKDANPIKLLVRHATETPKPVKELNPAVPDGLQQVLDAMLAKGPADRYATPNLAAAALKPFLGAGPERAAASADKEDYLRWLLEQAPDPWEIDVDLADAPAPPPVAPPAPVAPRPAPRKPAPARSAAPRVEESPTIDEIMPELPPPPPPPVPRKPARKKAKVEEVEEIEEVEPEAPAGLTRRDVMMLAIGIGGLAVAASMGLAAWAIFGRKRQTNDDTPDNPKPPAGD